MSHITKHSETQEKTPSIEANLPTKNRTLQGTDENPYQCKICDEAFQEEDELNNHETQEHDIDNTGDPTVLDENPNLCTSCGAAFLCRDKLVNHMTFEHSDVELNLTNTYNGVAQLAIVINFMFNKLYTDYFVCTV